MEKVSIDEVEPEPYDEVRHTDRRPLSDPLGTSDVAVTRYVLEPGERFSGALHAHADQEEVFVVLEGEATFRTRADGDPDSEEREVTVGAGEAVRFAPGEFQTGGSTGDERVVALALGAPRETEDVRFAWIPGFGEVACPECGRDDMRIPRGDESGLVCPDCDATLAVE